jgi:hypothetical protein
VDPKLSLPYWDFMYDSGVYAQDWYKSEVRTWPSMGRHCSAPLLCCRRQRSGLFCTDALE